MHPLDPYRAATLLLRQHGPDQAARHAAERVAELRAVGAVQGAAAWVQIGAAVEALAVRDGERVG